MEEQDVLRQRVVDAVSKFQKDQMSVSAESVSVDLHPNSLVVTLRGIACPADVRLKDIDAEQFHLKLLKEYGVGVIASAAHDVRGAFSCNEERDILQLLDSPTYADRHVTVADGIDKAPGREDNYSANGLQCNSPRNGVVGSETERQKRRPAYA